MEEAQEPDIVPIEGLPEDPLSMPPPYWRSSGAALHVVQALTNLTARLSELLSLHTATEIKLNEHYEKFSEDELESEAALQEFAEITDDLAQHEHKIRLEIEVACLMSAIEAEEEVNRFCVFNLHKHIAESIERLSLPEKLLVATGMLGHSGVKGESVFQAARRLSSWRNAFAHGHCVDRPTKSLRLNHLIYPEEYPGVPSGLLEVRELVGAYLRVSDYLRSISLNPYTAQESTDIELIRQLTGQLARYSFDGTNWAYDIILPKEEQRDIITKIKLAIASDKNSEARVENLIATLDPLKALILRSEFGMTDKTYSDEELQESLGIARGSLNKERAVAFTQVIGLEHLLFDSGGEEPGQKVG